MSEAIQHSPSYLLPGRLPSTYDGPQPKPWRPSLQFGPMGGDLGCCCQRSPDGCILSFVWLRSIGPDLSDMLGSASSTDNTFGAWIERNSEGQSEVQRSRPPRGTQSQTIPAQSRGLFGYTINGQWRVCLAIEASITKLCRRSQTAEPCGVSAQMLALFLSEVDKERSCSFNEFPWSEGFQEALAP